MSEADFAVDTGQTLLDLGDTRPARRLLTQGEHLLPATRDTTRGIFLAHQAANCLAHRDVEPAAHAATAALGLARRIHARRCERLVQSLTPAFRVRAPPRRQGQLPGLPPAALVEPRYRPLRLVLAHLRPLRLPSPVNGTAVCGV
ncbi:hypothetical protein [Streptomyces sp. NPDC021969]|uniref:hypothetical protein n=1 Tax=unclassified Streptomyces TaxID=2593676 RepID=UPI0033D88C87